jgi:hypothetical protein
LPDRKVSATHARNNAHQDAAKQNDQRNADDDVDGRSHATRDRAADGAITDGHALLVQGVVVQEHGEKAAEKGPQTAAVVDEGYDPQDGR